MPIYEYRCLACKRRTAIFVRTVNSPVRAECEHCGSTKMTRLMSKFAVQRATVNLDDPSAMDDLDENDPQAVARWARQMKDEAGEDLGPEFDDMITRIEAGEDPDDVMSGAEGDDGGLGDDEF